MADKLKKYLVHGTTIKHDGKLHEHGAEIELTDKDAEPLKKHLKEPEEKKK
ncbi:MAG: hypothetical protein M0Z75_07595 [Nitrospiraceae bacterium]|nr:hypothetical protein [Nitrospiraceae bacterium]